MRYGAETQITRSVIRGGGILRITDLIAKKRRGERLTADEIGFWIDGLETFADYQNSAMLMAIAINSMTESEVTDLTLAMVRSGRALDLSRYGECTVDKHSTGGVGDGTSFIVMPVMAAEGRVAAKLSGRGLGHTGGTLDKLESVDGVRTDLSEKEFFSILDKTGIAIAGQTAELCPADKYLYALRDVTATVDSTALIASSVMSKKLAAGARNIVLDVKTGKGAFMKTQQEAEELASLMVRIGRRAGRNTSALITTMDEPLETRVGNALEIEGALEVLRGEKRGDVYEVSRSLCKALGVEPERFDRAISSGAAYEKFESMIYAQGGRAGCLDRLPRSRYTAVVTAERGGYLVRTDAMTVAETVLDAGGGRRRKGDSILPEVGVVLLAESGDRVEKGQPLARLHYSREGDGELAVRLAQAFDISDERPKPRSRVVGEIV